MTSIPCWLRSALVASLSLSIVACAATSSNGDRTDASATDARTLDGGAADAGPDAGFALDATSPDALPADTGPIPDAGLARCAPLDAPSGPIVRVTPQQADDLPSIIASASPGTTIVLADGTYRMTHSDEGSRRIRLDVRGLTLRSESNRAEDVIIDGEYETNEMITVGADSVTIAHVTLTRAVDHLVHVSPGTPGANVIGTRIYGIRAIDAGEQFVKINSNAARDAWADSGQIECSTFELTDAGRPLIERSTGGCYTGGIDAHGARGWVVRWSSFRGIYCAGEGLAEHAIHFWTGSRDTLVENNTIVDCARGVGFGLVESGEARSYSDDPYPGAGYIGHFDGVIRNNVISSQIDYFDTGIELAQARGALVLHNTVVGAGAAFFSSIDYRFGETQVEIRNNLARRITARNGASGAVDHNLETTSMDDFVDPSTGDFHLRADATDAIDKGMPVAESGVDMDGDPHASGASPDLGADER